MIDNFLKMEFLRLSLILVELSVILCHCMVSGINESVLVIALPQVSSNEISVSWERGQELLPGALDAVDHINNAHSQGNRLSLVIADSGFIMSSDYPYAGNVLEVFANLTMHKSRIVGVAGLLHPRFLAICQSLQLHVASLIHFNGASSFSNVIYMTASSSTVIDSFLTFMKVISQTRIGIITEINNSFHLEFLHKVVSKVNVSFSIPVTPGHHQESFASIINTVASLNVYMTVLNVSPFLILPLLCEAYKNELTWPKYAWILHSYRFNDIPLTFNGKCNISNILEGMFVFQLIQEEINYQSEGYHNADLGLSNPYAYLLHDAVWTLTVAANLSVLNPHWIATTLPTSRNIYIYQIVNCTLSHAGVYNGHSKILENFTTGTPFLTSNLPVLRVLPSPYFLSLPALCFILNTILLGLFIYFRNESSVKSTSVCLSLLIFTGCYLLIVYTVVLIADIPPRIDVCMVLVWLSGLGISLPLILTTLLVKMLRVYRIFSLYRRVKPKVYTSECAHFLYSVLILSPVIVILIVWTIIDPHRSDDIYVEYPGFIIIEESCISEYAFLWLLLLLIYYLLLSTAVVIVAIKSRKIRLAQFKDTKKVNFLIFSVLFIGGSSFAYSNIFASTREYYFIPAYVLYFGHIIIAFLCPITLFIPKIWPPLAAKMSKNYRVSLNNQLQDPLLSVHSVTSIIRHQIS